MNDEERGDLTISQLSDERLALVVHYLADVVLTRLPESDRWAVRNGLAVRGLQVREHRPTIPE